MPKLPRWTAPEAERALLAADFHLLRSKGSHRIYAKATRRVVVPFHEAQLDGATLSFEWRFAGLGDGRTRLTQRVELREKDSGVYVPQLDSILRVTLPEGMKKIADRIATAAIAPSREHLGKL